MINGETESVETLINICNPCAKPINCKFELINFYTPLISDNISIYDNEQIYCNIPCMDRMLSRAVKDMVWGTVGDVYDLDKLYGKPSQEERRNMSTETQLNYKKYIGDYQQGNNLN